MSASAKQPVRFVAFGDNHGDMADPQSVEALLAFIADFKPSVRVCLGDAYDFRSLRRGVGNDAEAAESLKADVEEGDAFIRATKPTVWLWGNHEARLDQQIAGNGSALVRDYCQDLKDHITREARKSGVKTILPYHAEKGVYRLGPIAFIHGYAFGENATVKQGLHYAIHGGALVHGHTHTLASIALTQHGSGNAFSAGCLCRRDAMAYASHRLATSRWGNGFVAGWVDGDSYKAWLVHKIAKDRWVWTTDVKVFKPTAR